MKSGPDIARIASLLGDPARANIMTALMGGEMLTAGELAREAGVTPQTASSHLAKLTEGGLLIMRKQGRHAYFALAGPEVAETLESLMGLAVRVGHRRSQPGPRDPALRRARVCYDHLAGDLGVAMLEGLVAQGVVDDREGALRLGAAAPAFLDRFGIDPGGMRQGSRPVCRPCLDWSLRRSHLAGALGAALLTRVYDLGWARRVEGTRIVAFTPRGLVGFANEFGPVAAT